MFGPSGRSRFGHVLSIYVCVGSGVASVCSVDTTRWDGMTDRHAVSSREGQRLQLFLYGILINDLFVGGGPSPLLLSVPAGPGR